MNEGKMKRVECAGMVVYTSLILTYAIINLMNRHVWNIAFNPVDSLLKPFMIFPIMLLFLFILISWTIYACNQLKLLYLFIKNNTVAQNVATSFIFTFAAFNMMNVFVWNVGFTPVDSLLKPFLILPISLLVTTYFLRWTSMVLQHVKDLTLVFHRKGSLIYPKFVEKSLPINIIDESLLKRGISFNNSLLVDMRMKNNHSLMLMDDIDVVKLYNNSNPYNIPYLIERANLLMKDTSLKDKSIMFLVDSHDERKRTISKIWRRLIHNPYSTSAKEDCEKIKDLVYVNSDLSSA